ncbi:MAG: prephenate dehydrogenase/arogenate dehydrogenase family protein [Candidatus Dadabacteria bacterium]|nr:prephenate dehydrogenase/arogenate dehydrogenase family protein [Candidatus Dadabacteria bacterium]NIQ14189.1 prephenate dehydrogenase/arogenate dehydrogenase family protein [Candidatus Dadabacteria bacterium]
MKFQKVSIIGMGLIGGSLASALKKSNEVGEVIGIDRDKNSIDYALQNHIIDKGFLNYDNNIHSSDVVVLATYVDTIPAIAKEIKDFISKDTIVTDVGSVKSSIVREIESDYKIEYNFVGSHPIAGKEYSGVKYADPNLFQGKICIITPTDSTSSDVRETISNFWKLIGCSVINKDPESHDFIFSYVSHLPHLVAYSLVNAVASADSDLNLFEFAGGGLNDFTRIAGSSPEMWTSIFIANKEAVLESIKLFKSKINEIEEAVKSDNKDNLRKILFDIQSLKISF